MISHSSQNIRYHSPSNTYIISKKSYFDQDVFINGNAMVGPGAHFWKNVKISGNAQFGKGCVIEGRLETENALIGSQSVVKGPICASGDISLFQNVTVQSIESGGNVVIMEGCTADYINGKKLEIIGKAQVKKIGSITKMTVKADNMSSSNDSDEKNAEFSESETSLECVSEIEINTENNDGTEEAPSPQVNDLQTPSLPMENARDDAEFMTRSHPKPKISEIASVPQDEILDVELTTCDTGVEENNPDLQTIETPFGKIVVGDNSKTPSVSESTPSSASKSQISSSPQAVSPKRKPYPDFVPMVVPAHEKKTPPSQNKPMQPENQKTEHGDSSDLKNKSVSSKITFEALPLKAKPEETEMKKTEMKIKEKSADEMEAERMNSKVWYEARSKPEQKVSKEYPPYL